MGLVYFEPSTFYVFYMDSKNYLNCCNIALNILHSRTSAAATIKKYKFQNFDATQRTWGLFLWKIQCVTFLDATASLGVGMSVSK